MTDSATAISVGSTSVVVLCLVLTGPLVSVVDVGSSTDSHLGDGTATVETVSLTGEPMITDGRFGSGVAYLRIPDARICASSVSGHSRVVYQVSVPALGFERVGTARVPTSARSVQVGMADRAFDYDTVSQRTYLAIVTVRVQSFAVDRTVYRRNVSVEVTADG